MEATKEITPTLLDVAAIAQLTSEPFGPREGAATNTVLWRNGTSMAGLLTVAAGHRLGAHTHAQNHHHIWVVSGEALIVGQLLGERGYAHVPAGVEHDIDATNTDGCTVFYVYERRAPSVVTTAHAPPGAAFEANVEVTARPDGSDVPIGRGRVRRQRRDGDVRPVARAEHPLVRRRHRHPLHPLDGRRSGVGGGRHARPVRRDDRVRQPTGMPAPARTGRESS